MNARSFVALTACAVLLPSKANVAPPVKVERGLVQGIAEGDLTVYKGIP